MFDAAGVGKSAKFQWYTNFIMYIISRSGGKTWWWSPVWNRCARQCNHRRTGGRRQARENENLTQYVSSQASHEKATLIEKDKFLLIACQTTFRMTF